MIHADKTNFFIVGAPKAGTTSLYHYLDSHPDICMSSMKEPNFFSAPDLKEEQLYYDEPVIDTADQYADLFRECRPGSTKGEASVSYLYYRDVPERIKLYNPAAKIIILLRDPSTRAFSHWLMDERLGLVNEAFDDILDRKPVEGLEKYYTQYIRLGLYYEQVKRYIDTFGNENVLVFLQDDLRENADTVMKQLYSFLGVKAIASSDDAQEHNAARRINNPLLSVLYRSKVIRKTVKSMMPGSFSRKMLTGISSADDRRPSTELLKKLAAVYHDDIRNLGSLISRNLSKWNQ